MSFGNGNWEWEGLVNGGSSVQSLFHSESLLYSRGRDWWNLDYAF